MKFRNDELDAYLSRPYKPRKAPLIIAVIIIVTTVYFWIGDINTNLSNKALLEKYVSADGRVEYAGCDKYGENRRGECVVNEIHYTVDDKEYTLPVTKDNITRFYEGLVYYNPDNPSEAVIFDYNQKQAAKNPYFHFFSTLIFKSAAPVIVLCFIFAFAYDYLILLARRFGTTLGTTEVKFSKKK